MDARQPVIVSGVRTAIGSFGGVLKDVTAVDLGRTVIKETLRRAGVRPVAPEYAKEIRPSISKDVEKSEVEAKYMDWDQALRPVYIDEVIMGNVLQAGLGQHTGRQASIKAGVPQETTVFTINKLCASGIKAVALAAQAIRAGDADAIVAGGMESMTNVPYALPKARWGYRMDVTGKGEALDLMVFDGLWEILYDYHMGVTAENIARDYNISRREQDEVGAESHHRAMKAIKTGIFKQEIVPVQIAQRKGPALAVDTDERPMDTDVEKMGKLGAAFVKGGTVTAGNASGVNDGAAALLITSKEFAEKNGLKIRGCNQGLRLRRCGPQVHGPGPDTGDAQAAEEDGQHDEGHGSH